MNYNSNKNQAIKGKFIDREIIACASTLVCELCKNVEHFPEYQDDLYNAYEGAIDYEEAARNKGWSQAENGVFFLGEDDVYYLDLEYLDGKVSARVFSVNAPYQCTDGKKVWSFDGTVIDSENLGIYGDFDISDTDQLELYLEDMGIINKHACIYDYEECNFEISTADSWEQLCYEEDIDVYEYQSDVLEHWIVTDWLASRLEANGERILWDFFGFTVWGRTT